MLMLAALLGGCAIGGDDGGTRAPAALRLSLQPQVQAGSSELTVSVDAAGAAELYQLSCRVNYNPDALRPVDAQRGSIVDTRAAFFSTNKAAGYVPLAFTYHPGESAPTGSGSIARLRFQVLDASADPGLSIVTDTDLLVARDSARRDIAVSVEGAQ